MRSSSSPPRTSPTNPDDVDMDIDIDSPIAGIDSPIADIDSPLDSSRSQRLSMASNASHMQSPQKGRAGLRPSRPNQQYEEKKDGTDLSADSGVAVTIWGTNVNIDDIHRRFRRFIGEFEKNELVIYPLLIEESITSEVWNLNLDCRNIFQFDQDLYYSLVHFPQEVLPAFDEVVNTFAQNKFQDEMQELQDEHEIWTRPFNLLQVRSMRNMDPEHIDQLVAVRGMVIRSTTVIPDIQTAFFRCILCNQEVEVGIDMGRIPEPTKCPNQRCQGSHTMELIHNRCKFQDKQLVKVQETPECIPDGETPQTIDVYCYDHMVDYCKPGDRIEVTGVFRASAVRANSRRRQVESVYRTYVDSVHIHKSKSTSFSMGTDESDEAKDDEEKQEMAESDDVDILVRERDDKIKALAKDPNIYQRLMKSLAPSIWEMEDVKKGILCQLFGATRKIFRGDNQKKSRDQINILLCGDPGTSKSQLLTYVHKVSPRGIYTSGKGSSAVGLTAYISKDPDSGDLVLESGALVLSDRGICQIDEFDKMSEAARSILHEVMEQQTVSIAKAGIICTLNARTSILAAANPIESRYNPTKSVVENIDLPPTLMSRFDLIYLILDRPNETLDRKLAKHIVSLYYDYDEDGNVKGGSLPEEKDNIEVIDQKLLMEYISYTRREIQPTLNDDACEKLITSYVDMRGLGRMRGKKVITATPRQLESLIRLSEALAKMRHSEEVTGEDVDEAVRLHKVATLAAATDPRTGAIDLDSINVGQSAEDTQILMKQCNTLLQVIRDTVPAGTKTIRLSKLLSKYNAFVSAESEDDSGEAQANLTSMDMKKIVTRLKDADKLRPGDWLHDDPMIKILDTSDM